MSSGSSSAESTPGSSAKSPTLALANNTRPPRWFAMEREVVGRMQEGNRRDYSDPMLVSPQVRIATEDRHPELNASQRQAVDEIFLSREKVVGLDGIAARARRPRSPSSAKARRPRVTGWKVSRQRPARRRRWAKQAWRHPHYRSIWYVGSSRVPARNGSMYSTNPRWHRPGRCMSF